MTRGGCGDGSRPRFLAAATASQRNRDGAACVRPAVMQPWLLALVVVLAACGSVGTSSLPSPTPPPSPLRIAVERMAPALSFQAFVPDDLPAGLTVAASLFARSTPGDQQSNALGDPLLIIQFTLAGGGKTALTVLQGQEGCCVDLPRTGVAVDTVIRSARPGIRGSAGAEVRGQLFRTRTPTEGPSLSWEEPTAAGRRTHIALMATPFGTQFDEQGLLSFARSMRAIDRLAATDAIVLYLSIHTSHSPAGHRLFVAAKTGPVPDEARLLDARGQVVAGARFEQPKPYDCLRVAAAVAAFAVPQDVVEAFSRSAGTEYRVEARVGGTWRRVQLVSSGCSSVE